MDFRNVSKRNLRGYHQQRAIKRAHFQCIVSYNDTVANQNIPSPSEYGWRDETGGFSPVMTTMDPAPGGNIETSEMLLYIKKQSTQH